MACGEKEKKLGQEERGCLSKALATVSSFKETLNLSKCHPNVLVPTF